MATPLWETNDGQKWLAKAIDPAGMNVDLKGLPDQETHNVVVLNYQSQYAVSPPNMQGIAANDGSTFESEMFFYHHPYLFGVSASYPTGTVDPLSTSKSLQLSFGCDADTDNNTPAKAPYIKFNSEGYMFPRTCQAFINTQISGSTNVKEVSRVWGQLSQKHRVIYGALQAIPTCSAQDNSGSISVSQQPFVGDDNAFKTVNSCGENLTISNSIDGTTVFSDQYQYPVKSYRHDDFPNSEDNIRNPASLLTRFYEGAYIPYKLKNPFHEDFIVSDNKTASMAPYWTIGASYRNRATAAWTQMVWDDAAKCFTSPMSLDGTTRTALCCDRLCLRLMSRMGQEVDLVFTNNLASAANAKTEYTGTVDLNTPYVEVGGSLKKNLLNDLATPDDLISIVNSNKMLQTALTQDTSTNKNLYMYRVNPNGSAITELPSDNIVAVMCKAMNMKGNITLLFRIGVEIQVTGASTYSPFNHKSPAYDESAIKSYLRVVHQMSDGFYGNAASDMFHSSYYEWFMNMLYNPPADVDFANKGSYWRGVIRA